MSKKKVVRKKTVSKKRKINSVRLKKTQTARSSLGSLQQQIEVLKEENQVKDSIIKEYQKQLSMSNEVVLKMTQQVTMDLNILYKLHENLLPTQIPTIPHCEFSCKFISSFKGKGKDFYNIMSLYRMHFGLVMSSCVSHILSSLLFSSRLKLMARADYRKLQPAEVIEALINEMREQMNNVQLGSQVDIFYAITNQKKYQLTYCSIGKIFCLLYSISTGEIHELKSETSSFDGKNSISFKDEKIDLNPRDHLIVCSPGILECKNDKGEVYGKRRLKEVIQTIKTPGAHLLRNKIMHSLTSFVGGKKLGRDASVVVMEIKDKILKLT